MLGQVRGTKYIALDGVKSTRVYKSRAEAIVDVRFTESEGNKTHGYVTSQAWENDPKIVADIK